MIEQRGNPLEIIDNKEDTVGLNEQFMVILLHLFIKPIVIQGLKKK